MSYFEEIYQTCKVLAEHTGETELVPMLKSILAEIEALKQQVEQGKRDAERYLATLVISNEAIRQFRNEDMLARLIKLRGTQGYCQLVSAFDIGRDVIEAAIAAAPKQEK